tara:strand:- start:420 stop:1397 length:978 start_codon:yes stop_codon:yes gene_type:complete
MIEMNVEAYVDLEEAIKAVIAEKERLRQADEDAARASMEATKAIMDQFGAFDGLFHLVGTISNSMTGWDFSALEKFAAAQEKLKEAMAGEDVMEQIAAQEAVHTAQLEAEKSFYAQMGEMAANFIAEQAARKEAAIRAELDRTLTSLREERRYKRASDKKKKEMEDEVIAEAQAKLTKQFKWQQGAAIASVLFDMYKAAWTVTAGSPWTLGMPWSGLLLAQGAMATAAILAQEPPKAEHGGLIGGKRHSQGGTLINAEQGEFIMSRNAVQSVGLETLNRMNEGAGGTSNVTVNVSGNILTQDYVEDELAEAIKEAARRGTDFGFN